MTTKYGAMAGKHHQVLSVISPDKIHDTRIYRSFSRGKNLNDLILLG
jgi:hypothetical protein